MRRQVKPFVTEYRGSGRRSKDLSPSGDLQQDIQAPRTRSFAEAQRVFQVEAPDDTYEAALRAADALFSASAHDTEPARDAGPARVPEPREVRQATSAFRMPKNEAAKEAFADEGAAVPAAGEPAASVERGTAVPSRRILQAIEPPAEDRFAALEAERAPKRRGRKPGSKNKPKIGIGDDWASPPARPASTLTPALPVAAAAARSPAIEMEPDFADREPDDVLAPVAVEQAALQPRGRTDKFGWKRAGLRPGERWKRRLPKSVR